MSAATRDYLRRARRARRRMTPAQRAAFDAIVLNDLTLAEAAATMALDEPAVLRLFVTAFRIHVTEIDAPPWPLGAPVVTRRAESGSSVISPASRKDPPQKWGGRPRYDRGCNKGSGLLGG